MSTSTMFRPATRQKIKLRMALDGPAGSGKTYCALRFAFALGQRVAVIDTEFGSARKYQGESPDGIPWEFDVLELAQFAPSAYTEAIYEAGRMRYDVLVIDSLSHAWTGEGGALSLVDAKKNKFTDGWREVTPLHNKMIESIMRAPLHVIATMRTKMEHVLETNEQGKQVPRKIGMAPIQRQGMEYEFDIVGDIDHTHTLTVSKSRCSPLADAIVVKPTANFMLPLIHWLNHGVDIPQELVDAAGYRIQTEEEKAKAAAAALGGGGANGNGAAATPKVDAMAAMRAAAAAKAVVVPATATAPTTQAESGQVVSPAPTPAPAAPTTAPVAPATAPLAGSAPLAAKQPETIDVPSVAALTPTAPINPGSVENMSDPCTDKQRTEIKRLVEVTKMPKDRYDSMLKKFSAASLRNLTKLQAVTIIEGLKLAETKIQMAAMFDAQQAAKAATAAGVNQTEPATAPQPTAEAAAKN